MELMTGRSLALPTSARVVSGFRCARIPPMQTLNIAELRKEREALTKGVAALDKLLDAVDSFAGTGGVRNPYARREKATCPPKDGRR